MTAGVIRSLVLIPKIYIDLTFLLYLPSTSFQYTVMLLNPKQSIVIVNNNNNKTKQNRFF